MIGISLAAAALWTGRLLQRNMEVERAPLQQANLLGTMRTNLRGHDKVCSGLEGVLLGPTGWAYGPQQGSKLQHSAEPSSKARWSKRY